MVFSLGPESKYKLVWNVLAERKSAEEIVFGPFLAPKYSRKQDFAVFCSLEELLNIGFGDVILDVGYGPLARAENYFSLKGLEIVGLDVSSMILKKATEHVRKYGVKENVCFVQGDAEFLPFRRDSFGVVLCIGLISHLPSKKGALNSLREMRFCLEKNGVCYVDWLQNLYSLLGLQQELVCKVPDFVQADRVKLLHFRGLKEIRSLFRNAGPEIVKVLWGPLVYALTPAYHLFPANVKNGIDKLASYMDSLHEQHPDLAVFCYSFDVVTKKR
jgi:ubiquinone/menaquinone biosynthesis C-methylase UbiE